MQETDCCLAMMDDKLELMKREEGASRWSEQIQCAEFHMKMAARCCIPTKVCSNVVTNDASMLFTKLFEALTINDTFLFN